MRACRDNGLRGGAPWKLAKRVVKRRLALVSTIINLAHALSLNMLAQGVGTEEQARLLRLLNYDEMQVYLCSKPVSDEVLRPNF